MPTTKTMMMKMMMKKRMFSLLIGSVPIRWMCGIFFLLGPVAAGVAGQSCDVENCVSPQLDEATNSKDAHTICRLLTPSLHCMETHLPACRKAIGEDSEMYQQFVKKLDMLKVQYANKCNAIYTTCTEFTKCLQPQIQKASYKHDVQSLCKDTPAVIACFESAIHKCQSKSGEADVNFQLIESKLERLRAQTSSRCDGHSVFWSGTSSLLVVSLVTLVCLTTRLL